MANSSVDISTPEFANGQLVFRMPPEQVDPFIAALDPAVGRTVSLNGSTEDVTGQLRDLDARYALRVTVAPVAVVVAVGLVGLIARLGLPTSMMQALTGAILGVSP